MCNCIVAIAELDEVAVDINKCAQSSYKINIYASTIDSFNLQQRAWSRQNSPMPLLIVYLLTKKIGVRILAFQARGSVSNTGARIKDFFLFLGRFTVQE